MAPVSGTPPPTHRTKAGVEVRIVDRVRVGGRTKVACFRATGGWHGWLWLDKLALIKGGR